MRARSIGVRRLEPPTAKHRLWNGTFAVGAADARKKVGQMIHTV